jgi:class 3 adenylate cyclase/predicted ATPase
MPRAGEAERRQLTVMFCDLVDSTPLSERLDPEVLRDIINDYQQACGDVVGRYEGHIAQYLGDGLLIYFGFPQAHEDDAVRAVRAGLEMMEAVGRLSTRLQKEKDVALSIRIGIHTGLVVIGEIGGPGRRERLALGDTTNIAARLQSLAEPNSVVISEATRRLSGSYFEIAALGRMTLKGFSVPIELHHVLGTSGIRSRYEASGSNGRTPFAGREKETGMLLEWWSRATIGQSRTVVISGEAGIGKSRLVDVLKQRIADVPYHLLEFHSSQYSRNSAFQPVIQTLMDVFGLSIIQPSERLRHLEATLTDVGVGHPEAMALVASLLGIANADDSVLGELTPQRRRQRTIETVIDLLEAISRDLPSLVVVEDLHWSDPSTLDLLERLIERSESMRVLTLLTCRPSFERRWNSASRMERVDLERLPQGDVEAMIIRLAAGRELPAEVRGQILARTDGIPLFVEELTKMVIESTFPTGQLDRFAPGTSLPHPVIPTTLNDSLMARLDRLGPAREIAQIGATIGRRFSYRLLQSVSGIDEGRIRAALDRLVGSELLTRQGTPPEAEFTFRHALIQDAAYESLLHTRRQTYHREIARVLEEEFPETLQMQPELLAHHYSMAGVVPRAILFWQLAGQSAIERSAHTEAIHHLEAGLELLMTLPADEKRDQQELSIRVMLGVPLMNRMGWGALELVANYERALSICHCIEDSPHRFPILVGLAISAYIRGDLADAAELGDRCIGIAELSGRTDLRLQAHRIQAPVLLWQGEFRKARHHAGIAAALYDPVEHSSHAIVYGHDPGSSAISYISWLDWFLGFPDKAVEASIRALELARGRDEWRAGGASLAGSYFPSILGGTLLRNGRLEEARETIDEGIEFASNSSEHICIAELIRLKGELLMHSDAGRASEAEAHLREAITIAEAQHTLAYRLRASSSLYQLLRDQGRDSEGRAILSACLAQFTEGFDSHDLKKAAELLTLTTVST